MFSSAWAHRYVIRRLIRHDLQVRHRSSLLGLLSMFLHPLLMLALYLFVFSVVFGIRQGMPTGRVDFAFSVFVGMTVFAVFSECISAAPHALRANPNYVKKVVFPLEILVWVDLGSALLRFAAAVVALLACFALVKGQVHPVSILLPVVLLPLALHTLGVSWLLSAAGVFSGEVSRLMGSLTSALIFLSPVFYPAKAVPMPFSRLMDFNPLTAPIENARLLVLAGEMPEWRQFTLQLVVAAGVAWLGFFIFQRFRSEFADVL